MSHRLRLACLLLLPSLLFSACSGDVTPSPGAATPGTGSSVIVAKPSSGGQLINGAGATFPYPLYSRWFYEYLSIDPAAKFNYQSIGSGGGIKQIKSRTVDFAGSDAILSKADYDAVAPARLQMLPTVAGAVVPTYSVKELQGKKLVLDGTCLAGIFLGKIKKWNDPAISALNSDLKLPDKDIVVVHRSDGSGTSYIFTDFLSSASPEWKQAVGAGTSVKWPVGLGGKGNEGVTGAVAMNEGAIGYVELAFAQQNNLAIAAMKNAAGAIVTAETRSVQSAMADFGSDMPDTLARSIVNAPGKDSWPIAGYTYLIIYMDQSDCFKAQKLVGLIAWALSDAGSKGAAELEYVPLPAAIRDRVLAKIKQVTCQGQPLT